jgi:serine/threonine protein kinase
MVAVAWRSLAIERHQNPQNDLGDALHQLANRAIGSSERPTSHESDALARAVNKAVNRRAIQHALNPERPLLKIGRFDALVCIGRGGFGIVFKARDPRLDRWVALKLCLTSSPRAIEGLMDEARVLAGLKHPNIVMVYEPGDHDGAPFFAMEYIEGENAQQFGKRDPRPTWQQSVDVFRGVARGLVAAHGAKPKIVHGDIKPSNVLLDLDDVAHIADFGLGRRVIEDAEESEQEGLRRRAGTLHYMAPEVLRGQHGDALSDQWSFCVSLCHILNGVVPFRGDTSDEILDEIEHTEVQFEDPSIPQELIAVLRKGLSRDPSMRFPDMKALLAELDRIRQSPPSSSPPDEPERTEEPHESSSPPDEPKPERADDRETPELTPVGGGGPAVESKARRGTYAVALLLVGAAVGWMGRPSVEVREATAEPEPVLPISPCALDEDTGSSVAIDSVLLDVCQQIRNSELDDADRAWTREYLKRRSATPDELAADTMIVARTFFDQAEVITRSEQFQHDGRTLTAIEQQALARKAAGHSTLWLEHSLNLAHD